VVFTGWLLWATKFNETLVSIRWGEFFSSELFSVYQIEHFSFKLFSYYKSLHASMKLYQKSQSVCVMISVLISDCWLVCRYLLTAPEICSVETSGRLENVNFVLRYQVQLVTPTEQSGPNYWHLSRIGSKSCNILLRLHLTVGQT
jgi:hypothetical protein